MLSIGVSFELSDGHAFAHVVEIPNSALPDSLTSDQLRNAVADTACQALAEVEASIREYFENEPN
jgi:hypothetical protein